MLADVQTGRVAHKPACLISPSVLLWRLLPALSAQLVQLVVYVVAATSWFITNRKGGIRWRLLVAFQYRPSLLKIPRIFLNALLS
jgi:hypothetical protein